MVIFHSYVSLPEGNVFVQFNPEPLWLRSTDELHIFWSAPPTKALWIPPSRHRSGTGRGGWSWRSAASDLETRLAASKRCVVFDQTDSKGRLLKKDWKRIGKLMETSWKAIGKLLESYWKPSIRTPDDIPLQWLVLQVEHAICLGDAKDCQGSFWRHLHPLVRSPFPRPIPNFNHSSCYKSISAIP